MRFGNHRSAAVTIEHRRDDAAVEVSHAVVVLRPRGEACRDHVVIGEAAQLQSARVGVATPEARERRVEPLLDGLPLAGRSRTHAKPRTARTGGLEPRMVAIMSSVCRVSATLWARNTRAPSQAHTDVAAS